MQVTDLFSRLIFPVLMGLAFAILFYLFNRTIRAGRPMKPYEKRLLGHGSLFMMGMVYFMAWNDELAVLLRFPGREIWRPLAFGWALVLLWDALRRLQRERQTKPTPEVPAEAYRTANSVRGVVLTGLRFLLFFAVVGVIGRRTLSGFAVTATILIVLLILSRRWRTSSVGSEVSRG
jgi:hypothetical protein